MKYSIIAVSLMVFSSVVHASVFPTPTPTMTHIPAPIPTVIAPHPGFPPQPVPTPTHTAPALPNDKWFHLVNKYSKMMDTVAGAWESQNSWKCMLQNHGKIDDYGYKIISYLCADPALPSAVRFPIDFAYGGSDDELIVIRFKGNAN